MQLSGVRRHLWEIRDGNYTTRLKLRDSDNLTELVDPFNEMAACPRGPGEEAGPGLLKQLAAQAEATGWNRPVFCQLVFVKVVQSPEVNRRRPSPVRTISCLVTTPLDDLGPVGMAIGEQWIHPLSPDERHQVVEKATCKLLPISCERISAIPSREISCVSTVLSIHIDLQAIRDPRPSITTSVPRRRIPRLRAIWADSSLIRPPSIQD